MSDINNKKGQVILVALLIMAVVLVVALAIGTLMLRELRMAGNIDRSITAYFAAESGLEEELWKARKNPPMDAIPYGEGLAIEGARWDLTKSEAPEEEFVEKVLVRDKSEQIYLKYDPSDPENINRFMFEMWSSPTAWLEYKVISWPTYDSTGKIPLDPSEVITKEGLWGTSDVPNICINLNEGTRPIYYYDHVFRFKPLYADVSYTLKGYSDTSCTPANEVGIKGGKLEITSTGTYSATKRSLSIVFYPKPPLHGIFDYVLFSDESIVK